MIRLIVSDLDGTLLSDHETIHPENVAAIKAAMEQGIHFAVASGRSAASCSVLLRMHGLEETPILAVNGCHIVEKPFGRTLAMHCMTAQAARESIDIMEAHGLEGCLYAGNAIVYTSQSALRECEGDMEASDYHDMLRSAGERVEAGLEAMRAAIETTPMKTFCLCQPGQEEAFARAREASAHIADTDLTSSWISNFEVMPAGVDKGTAVRDLAAQLGIAREDVLAFGDNDNDLPMLRWAGHGVAMRNSVPVVLEEIRRVTGHCRDGGVAKEIYRVALS